VFLGILRKQLILKGICTEEDWEEWKDNLFVDFVKDNYFTELTELDIFKERVAVLNDIAQYVGDYFSKEWVMRQILKFSDEDIDNMKGEIGDERSSGEIPDDMQQGQAPQSSPSPAPQSAQSNEPQQ
jgi:hypothetical protein